MWLFTKNGFYSVVLKPGEGKLTIRSRVRQDLVALKRDYIPNLSKIIDLPVGKADYQFRATASRGEWAKAVAKMASEIDYANFKDEVFVNQGSARSSIYHRVWAILLDLETLAGRMIGGGLRSTKMQTKR